MGSMEEAMGVMEEVRRSEGVKKLSHMSFGK